MKRHFMLCCLLVLVCGSNFAQGSKTVLDDFNPVLGGKVVLGETDFSTAQAFACGYAADYGSEVVVDEDEEDFKCPGFSFYGYGSSTVMSFFVKESEFMPKKWKEHGFSFSKSYNEWCDLFEDLGLRKYVKESPQNEDGCFQADVKFYAEDESVCFYLCFYKFGQTLSVDSKNTLSFIAANTVGTVYPGKKTAAESRNTESAKSASNSGQPSYTPCMTCGGTGQVMMPAGITGPMWTTCFICGGSGKIYYSAPTYVPGYNPAYVPVQQGSGNSSGSTNGGTVKQNNTTSSHKGCPHCEFPGNDYQAGNGVCKMCGGSGKIYGGFGLDARDCSSCRGDGKCHFCNGTGWR